MKIKQLKQLFSEAVQSRTFIALWIVALLQTIILILVTLINTHNSGLQIPIHWDIGDGVPLAATNVSAQWYYMFGFVAFAVVALALNVLISLKLLKEKGRVLALAWMWLMVAVLLVAMVLLFAMISHVVGHIG